MVPIVDDRIMLRVFGFPKNKIDNKIHIDNHCYEWSCLSILVLHDIHLRMIFYKFSELNLCMIYTFKVQKDDFIN